MLANGCMAQVGAKKQVLGSSKLMQMSAVCGYTLAFCCQLQVGADGGEEVLGSWPAGAPLGAEAACEEVLNHLAREGLSAAQAAALRCECVLVCMRDEVSEGVHHHLVYRLDMLANEGSQMRRVYILELSGRPLVMFWSQVCAAAAGCQRKPPSACKSMCGAPEGGPGATGLRAAAQIRGPVRAVGYVSYLYVRIHHCSRHIQYVSACMRNHVSYWRTLRVVSRACVGRHPHLTVMLPAF
jgi:hypothetical protein